jgi:adenosylcobyric acid synthase
VSTRFASRKTLRQVEGETLKEGCKVAGYEIHLGETSRGSTTPLFRLCAQGSGASVDAAESAVTFDGVRDDARRVWGTYLHGLFDEPSFVELYLKTLRPEFVFHPRSSSRQHLEVELDRLADHVAAHIDLARIRTWMR